MTAPLHFTRTAGDDGLHIARARADGWLLALSSYRKDSPVSLHYDSGNTGFSTRLTAQQARAIAAELLSMADLAEQAATAAAHYITAPGG